MFRCFVLIGNRFIYVIVPIYIFGFRLCVLFLCSAYSKYLDWLSNRAKPTSELLVAFNSFYRVFMFILGSIHSNNLYFLASIRNRCTQLFCFFHLLLYQEAWCGIFFFAFRLTDLYCYRNTRKPTGEMKK